MGTPGSPRSGPQGRQRTHGRDRTLSSRWRSRGHRATSATKRAARDAEAAAAAPSVEEQVEAASEAAVEEGRGRLLRPPRRRPRPPSRSGPPRSRHVRTRSRVSRRPPTRSPRTPESFGGPVTYPVAGLPHVRWPGRCWRTDPHTSVRPCALRLEVGGGFRPTDGPGLTGWTNGWTGD